MGTINAASVESSDRLQRVADLLADGQEHSTMEIVLVANVCAVNSIITELRVNGFDIECRRHGGAWFYRLNAEVTGAPTTGANKGDEA